MVDEVSLVVPPLPTPRLILCAPCAIAGRGVRMETILHRLTSPGPVAANIAAGVRKGCPVSPPIGAAALHLPALACGGARLFPSTVWPLSVPRNANAERSGSKRSSKRSFKTQEKCRTVFKTQPKRSSRRKTQVSKRRLPKRRKGAGLSSKRSQNADPKRMSQNAGFKTHVWNAAKTQTVRR